MAPRKGVFAALATQDSESRDSMRGARPGKQQFPLVRVAPRGGGMPSILGAFTRPRDTSTVPDQYDER